jgi:hypothetical protein
LTRKAGPGHLVAPVRGQEKLTLADAPAKATANGHADFFES